MIKTNLELKRFKFIEVIHSFNGIIEWPIAHQNVAGVLTGRGLMDCLQYYENCLFYQFYLANAEDLSLNIIILKLLFTEQ
jgi:hypothetical protein